MWGYDDSEAFHGCGPGCLGCDYCRKPAPEPAPAPVVLSEGARDLLRRLLTDRGAVEIGTLDAKLVDELDAHGLVAIYRGHVCARGVKP
jgi:hypothetical protein